MNRVGAILQDLTLTIFRPKLGADLRRVETVATMRLELVIFVVAACLFVCSPIWLPAALLVKFRNLIELRVRFVGVTFVMLSTALLVTNAGTFLFARFLADFGEHYYFQTGHQCDRFVCAAVNLFVSYTVEVWVCAYVGLVAILILWMRHRSPRWMGYRI